MGANMSKKFRLQKQGEKPCFIPADWVELPLVAKTPANHDSTIFEFGLNNPKASLNLPTCACILLSPGVDEDGKDIVRPYTPISSNKMKGKFQLLIKKYPNGKASQAVHNMCIGDKVKFKHIPFNVKIQYPFGKKSISMINGGSGITPMFQALRMLLETAGDNTEIVMLNTNRTADDILMKDELDAYEKQYPNRFRVVHTLTANKSDDWQGKTGRIDQQMISEHCFPPSNDTMVFVCGVPAMYDSLCGPRTEKAVAEGSILNKLGYTDSMVFKF